MFILNKGDAVLSLKLLFKQLALCDAADEYENKPYQRGVVRFFLAMDA